MVDHCGLPYERDEATMKLWREGEWQPLDLWFSCLYILDTQGFIQDFEFEGGNSKVWG